MTTIKYLYMHFNVTRNNVKLTLLSHYFVYFYIPEILTGDPCPVNGVCLDPHAVCETDCVCQDGFTLDGADTCVPCKYPDFV